METLVPKGLKQIFEEDKSLREKITYNEFIQKKIVPQNSDEPIDDVYENYLKIKAGE